MVMGYGDELWLWVLVGYGDELWLWVMVMSYGYGLW